MHAHPHNQLDKVRNGFSIAISERLFLLIFGQVLNRHWQMMQTLLATIVKSALSQLPGGLQGMNILHILAPIMLIVLPLCTNPCQSNSQWSNVDSDICFCGLTSCVSTATFSGWLLSRRGCSLRLTTQASFFLHCDQNLASNFGLEMICGTILFSIVPLLNPAFRLCFCL